MPRKLDNWLLSYADYVAGTESPAIYHLWVALGTIAAAAQRKIQLKMGKITVHSNMCVVLVGPSGGPRKTTALDFGEDILRKSEEYGVKYEIAPRKASSASLISRMARIANPEHQSITAYSSELGTLLGAKSTDVTDILTDLWDCKAHWDKETIGRGVEKITAPWINIIAATTPIWLADNLPSTASEGGFVSRGLYVFAEDNDSWVPIPEETPEQQMTGRALAHDLALIAQMKDTFQFSESARKFYSEWYLDRSNFAPKYDNRMHTFYNRKHVHVLKAAMAISLATNDSFQLETRDIGTAIDMVEEVERSMSMAFQGVGRNMFSMDHERIKAQILKSPRGLTYREILTKNIHQIDKQQIDIALSTLVQMGIIHQAGGGGDSVFMDRRVAEVKR